MTIDAAASLTVHEPVLVNALGHVAGTLLFAIFLVLLCRDRGIWSRSGAWRSLAAAVLALVWNLGSLALLFGSPGVPLLLITSTAALSLLPAVLLDLSLEGGPRWMVRAGYALSAAAIALHVADLWSGDPEIHRRAVVMTAWGFAILTVTGAALLVRRHDAHVRVQARMVGAMALLLFALSFAHFHPEGAHHAWQLELLVHHAGIPLSLFVLLQDYRFVLLDAFVRFLANILLAGLLTWLGWLVASGAGWVDAARLPARIVVLAVVLACALLILYGVARGAAQRLLAKVFFSHGELEHFVERLRTLPAEDRDQYLTAAAGEMGAFSAARARLLPSGPPGPASHRAAVAPPEMENDEIQVLVPVPLSAGGPRWVALGRRAGGRRYVSEDLHALDHLAREAGARLDRVSEDELRRLAAQAELRALQAQIHPHFLFNALNILYGIIPREAAGARRTVLNLADIFRYFLRNDRMFIPLGEELEIVRAYLEVEGLRLGDKMHSEIQADPRALATRIPALSLQPLVENAVKHGVAAQARPGEVRVEARIDGGWLEVAVSDTGPGFRPPAPEGERRGVGLENVRRRLRLCYGDEARLDIVSGASGTRVGFRVPAARASAA